MLQIPAILLSLILITIYAALFFLWQGRRLSNLPLFWMAAAAGFASGQLAGHLLNLAPWTLGQIHIVEATLVAFLFLVLGYWLRQEKEKE